MSKTEPEISPEDSRRLLNACRPTADSVSIHSDLFGKGFLPDAELAKLPLEARCGVDVFILLHEQIIRDDDGNRKGESRLGDFTH